MAHHTDSNLKNGWGLAFFSSGPFWVSDNDTGVSTVYFHFGKKIPLIVTIPPAPSQPFGPVGTPTGIVANSTSGFTVSEAGKSGPASFLFATLDGTISGWNSTVDATNAIIAVDNSSSFALYTGLAIATTASGTFLYAADAVNNQIDEYDSNFNLVRTFTDPNAPAGLAVYGIQTISGLLYVTFGSPIPFQGGVVDVFGTDGTLIQTLAVNGTAGPLEAPWGTAIAPANFGPFSLDLLVGNVDDGHISAFDPNTGAFLGQLTDNKGNTIAIGGLWALQFGAGSVANGNTNQLFFTAGPNNYVDGLFGVILPPE